MADGFGAEQSLKNDPDGISASAGVFRLVVPRGHGRLPRENRATVSAGAEVLASVVGQRREIRNVAIGPFTTTAD
jgi:hypothetical protein